jgi:Cu+-exporting ATPase
MIGETLGAAEQSWVYSLAQHSTHPHAVRIAQSLVMASREASFQPSTFNLQPSTNITEIAGQGLAGTIAGHDLRLGSRAWLKQGGIAVPDTTLPPGSVSHLAIDGQYRGAFVLANTLRPEADRLLACLDRHYEIALLSGDNEKECELFRSLFGTNAHLHFNQSPLDKLGFIRQLQAAGKTVMMVGDGLNDAGALQQSDVGVALVEKVGTFSPASDVILDAAQVTRLFGVLALARKTAKVVRFSFGISALYNVIGISIAAAGILSPLICAVLMPLSSISVVLFACGETSRAADLAGFRSPPSALPDPNSPLA